MPFSLEGEGYRALPAPLARRSWMRVHRSPKRSTPSPSSGQIRFAHEAGATLSLTGEGNELRRAIPRHPEPQTIAGNLFQDPERLPPYFAHCHSGPRIRSGVTIEQIEVSFRTWPRSDSYISIFLFSEDGISDFTTARINSSLLPK